jgi:hypothetical protein
MSQKIKFKKKMIILKKIILIKTVFNNNVRFV